MPKKPLIVKSLLIIWLVLATGYILFDIYSRYQATIMQKVYATGVTDTVNSLIKQTEQSNCQPFSVYNASTTVSLLDVKCLQQPTASTSPSKP